MRAVALETGQWLEDFTRQAAVAPWMQQLREYAFQRFAETGFPTTHDEEWRFTNVAPIARAPEFSWRFNTPWKFRVSATCTF